MAFAIFTEGQNLNFAVPSQYVQPILTNGKQLSLDDFAKETDFSSTAKVERQVPVHDLAVLQGCTDADLLDVTKGIANAIEIGAPLYNSGDHESCYKIYEMTSERFRAAAWRNTTALPGAYRRTHL